MNYNKHAVVWDETRCKWTVSEGEYAGNLEKINSVNALEAILLEFPRISSPAKNEIKRQIAIVKGREANEKDPLYFKW